MKKGHCIKETSVKVTLENEAERTETQTDIIEVTGDDDIETLKLYFEGRRSGGNRSKAVEYVTKVDANVVHVKFKSTDGKLLITLNNSFKLCLRCCCCHCSRKALDCRNSS